ncbi:hypothetical protein EOM39_07800 [Candidatus Gracilibacteria bacterium]|nr:hypothetical protein [Candidatus Gracilibacteria bacterium]
MFIISSIFEKDYILDDLNKRGLLNQYKKSKEFIIAGIYGKTDLKLRKPEKDGIYSFRINKQFRAFCYLQGNNLVVYKIDNHQ